MTGARSKPIRVVAGCALGLVVIAIAAIAAWPEDFDDHRITVTTTNADGIQPGQYVRLAGTKVGIVKAVDSLDGGRKARIEFGVNDDAWPLTERSTLAIRWGGTVNLGDRYMTLTPGTGGANVADGGSLPPSALSVPTEYDELVRTFAPPVRRDLKRMFDNGGTSLSAARLPLTKTLSRTPPALREAGAVLQELVRDEETLDGLIRNTDTVTAAVAAAEPDIRALLSGAGTTLAATAAEADNLRATLDLAPATFANIRDTLKQADPILASVGSAASDLAPGIVELRRDIGPLAGILDTVVDVGPTATDTLSVARRATADVNPFLRRTAARLPDLGSIGKQLTEQLPCLRPYTPDIMAFFTVWADFISSTDGKDHYFRAFPQSILPATTNTQTYTSAEAAKLFPGLRFAFPRPPGESAGKPWFLPRCGVTEDALNPAKDPEARG